MVRPADAAAPVAVTGRAPPPIPLSVVAGFPGAGKTTLLARAAAAGRLDDALVVVDDASGEADRLMIAHARPGLRVMTAQAIAGEDSAFAGCLCCTARGAFAALLEQLLRAVDNRRMPPFARLALEAGGLADPAALAGEVLAHPYLSKRFVMAEAITVVDGPSGAAALARWPEARAQVAAASSLAVSRGDAPPALVAALAALNPAAPVTPETAFFGAPSGAAPLGDAARRGLYAAVFGARRPAPPVSDIQLDRFTCGPLSPAMIDDIVSAVAAAGALRLKGLAQVEGEGGALFGVVAGAASPVVRLRGESATGGVALWSAGAERAAALRALAGFPALRRKG